MPVKGLLKRRLNRPLWFLAALISLAFSPAALSQDLARQPTAFTAYLDFQSKPAELPIWIERVDKQTVQADGTAPETTIYRIRFRHFAGLVDEVLLRVYFQDTAGAQPVFSGWSEIGARVLGPQTLGEGARSSFFRDGQHPHVGRRLCRY